MIRLGGINIPKRLNHANLFSKKTMENSKRENHSNSWRLDDWTKSFFKINTILLMKPFSNPFGLVSTNTIITVMLEFEHLLAPNRILSRRVWN